VRGIPFPGGTLSVRVGREDGTQVLEAPPGLVVEVHAGGPGSTASPARPLPPGG
jgi:hypothetical protein